MLEAGYVAFYTSWSPCGEISDNERERRDTHRLPRPTYLLKWQKRKFSQEGTFSLGIDSADQHPTTCIVQKANIVARDQEKRAVWQRFGLGLPKYAS